MIVFCEFSLGKSSFWIERRIGGGLAVNEKRDWEEYGEKLGFGQSKIEEVLKDEIGDRAGRIRGECRGVKRRWGFGV